MHAARLRSELRAKRFGVHVESTFMAGTSMATDIHVYTGVAVLS
jgi:hypothetical protein